MSYGGEGGIRTHGTVSRTLAFEASTFNRSVTSPRPFTAFYQRGCSWGYAAFRTNCCSLRQAYGRDLATGCEEGLEKGTGFFGEDAWGDFDMMIQLGVGQEFEAGSESTAFWIIGSVHHARDAGLDDRSGTHCAGFQSYVQHRLGQAIIFKFSRSFAQDHDFGVRGWVAVADRAVAAA
jgi:hypothetical protein